MSSFREKEGGGCLDNEGSTKDKMKKFLKIPNTGKSFKIHENFKNFKINFKVFYSKNIKMFC